MGYYGRFRPTQKQRKAAMLKLEGMTNKQAVIEAGYSEATAHNAHHITNSQGYKRALYEMALSMSRPTAAFVAKANELATDDSVTPREALKLLNQILDVQRKLQELAGLGKQKENNNIINIDVTEIIE